MQGWALPAEALLGEAWQGGADPGTARRGHAVLGRAWLGKARTFQSLDQGKGTDMFITTRVRGITPLICNRFTDAAAEAASSGTRSSVATTDRGTPLDIAESKLYLCPDGSPGIPQPNLLRCMVEGGLFHKIGRNKVTTQKSSLLYSCLDIEGAMIPLIHKQPWKVDTRPVRIPATGGRILAHRPMFDDWELDFVLDVDLSIMSPKMLRQIVDDAGKRIGLGDFRPATKGPFGRFVVVVWQEQAQPLAEAA
jgi:hypothetical protein